MQIAIVNASKNYPGARLGLLAEALTKLSWGTYDPATGEGSYSIWHESWSIDLQAVAWPPGVPVPAGMARLIITDEEGPPNVGGQHYTMPDGTPIGFTYMPILGRLGLDPDPITFHEYWEMGNDSSGRDYALDDRTSPVKFYSKESSDQVNGETIDTGVLNENGDTIKGSNVVLASLMDINGKPPFTLKQALNQQGGGDVLAVDSQINAPFKIMPFGYWAYWADGVYTPIHGSDVPPQKVLDT